MVRGRRKTTAHRAAWLGIARRKEQTVKTENRTPLGITIDGPEWSLAWADHWRPLLRRYHAELEWLLDMAADAARELPSERAAVGRVRTALRQLVGGASARVDSRDLMFTLALVLAAIERDLGPVETRPRRFRRHDLLIEAIGTLFTNQARKHRAQHNH